jgi:hypothetical protein
MPMIDITREIQKQLKYYAKDVAKKIDESQDEIASQLVQNLKQDSPKRRPSYAKGWRVKKVKGKSVIHNATDYQLTHLLEHGHATRNGERFDGEVHIRPNEEKAIRDFLKEVERAIEQ